MMVGTISLKDTPTLADLRAYVTAVVTERRLDPDVTYSMLLLCEEVGELAKAVRKSVGGKMDAAKPDANIAEEAADVLWMLLFVCAGLGIDLAQAFRDKDRQKPTTSLAII